MKTIYQFFFCWVCIACLSCHKRQFFEDANNPGLSRFTRRDYDVTSAYINEQPWVNGFSSFSGPSPMSVKLVTSTALKDTLYITWNGAFTNENVFPSATWKDYGYLSICIPVAKNFSAANFLSWNNKSFATDTIPVRIALGSFEAPLAGRSLSGKGNIYFVRIAAEAYGQSTQFKTSGLFEGNIGDSILITKGRFDYQVAPINHNLR